MTENMNAKLAMEYIAEEMAYVIKEMTLLKAPGSDGMPPLFYQSYWPNIGMDVTQAILSCVNSSSILRFINRSINHTFITLIPKVKNLKRVIEFIILFTRSSVK